MTIKEILSEITEYISLSPIAHTHFNKSRQWLYHKINEDIINKVQYKLSDEEINILISALNSIKNSISNVTRNLEEFKTKREYLKIPEEDCELLEKYKEQMRELNIARKHEEQKELLREIYRTEISSDILKFADWYVSFMSWELLNLKGDTIKYAGESVKMIVDNVILAIKEEIEAEEKKNDDDEVEYDNNDIISYSNFQSEITTLTYKMYYKLNKLTPTEHIQKMITKLPQTITFLENRELSEIENLIYQKFNLQV